MSCYIERLTPEHLDLIQLREPDKTQTQKHPRYQELVRSYPKIGPAYAVVAPEGVVMAGGVAISSSGVGTAWALTSELVNKYPKSVYKFTRDMLNAIMADLGLWRVQTSIYTDNAVAARWIERLGFDREGLMRKSGPGKDDCYLYAKVVT